MPERDGYIPGVPCWADTNQPDPDAAAEFYGALFGWELEDVIPPGGPGKYLIGRIRGGDVAAISSQPEGVTAPPGWTTYVWVESADETAAKAREAGATVVMEPDDIFDAGRMAVFADPEGAVISAWQSKQHRGSKIVNEHGSVNFNTLHTGDLERAKEFYGAVFGWDVLDLGGGGVMWTLPGYGDHLELDNPGMREGMEQMGAPKGFEDVVASAVPLADGAPHWGVVFAVDDADDVAARAYELGGRVISPPVDAPWVRTTTIADPAGATFTANKFVPENSDLDPAGARTSSSPA